MSRSRCQKASCVEQISDTLETMLPLLSSNFCCLREESWTAFNQLRDENGEPSENPGGREGSSSTASRPSQKNHHWTSVSSLKGENLHHGSEGEVKVHDDGPDQASCW